MEIFVQVVSYLIASNEKENIDQSKLIKFKTNQLDSTWLNLVS